MTRLDELKKRKNSYKKTLARQLENVEKIRLKINKSIENLNEISNEDINKYTLYRSAYLNTRRIMSDLSYMISCEIRSQRRIN